MSVVLLSGGVDSAVVLGMEVFLGQKTTCLGFHYNQRHARELKSARAVARHFGCDFTVLDIDPSLFDCPLTGIGDIPHAHYEDPIQVATVVPNRNAVMLSMAVSMAARSGFDEVLFGAHRGDAAVYADCRPEFVEAFSRAMGLACGVKVDAPLLGYSKREVVKLGRKFDVPFDLTWSCYEGGEDPCGKCGACVERAEAMA